MGTKQIPADVMSATSNDTETVYVCDTDNGYMDSGNGTATGVLGAGLREDAGADTRIVQTAEGGVRDAGEREGSATEDKGVQGTVPLADPHLREALGVAQLKCVAKMVADRESILRQSSEIARLISYAKADSVTGRNEDAEVNQTAAETLMRHMFCDYIADYVQEYERIKGLRSCPVVPDDCTPAVHSEVCRVTQESVLGDYPGADML